MTVILVAAGAGIAAFVASIVFTWSSNRSALFNMAFGALLAFAAIGVAFVIAWILTRVYLSPVPGS